MKVYWITVWLFHVFSHLYFVAVRSLHSERIPKSGPVILAANHPASVLDAILLTMQTRRQIHFLVKSSLFRSRLLGSILHRLGAIPVYRASEGTGSDKRNVAVFEKAYELFERAGCLGLFPEGKNSPFGQVFNLRTGCARIALGAEARNNYQLGLSIVPVGLNFERRGFFLSTVLLRFGPPLQAAEYAGLHRENPEEAVGKMTADLQASLRREAMHVENKQISELADDLSSALGYRLSPLAADAGLRGEQLQKRSRLKRWIWKLLDWYRPSTEKGTDQLEFRLQSREYLTDVLTWASAHEPSSVSDLRRLVDRFQDHLLQTRLSRSVRESLDKPARERLIRLRMTIYAIAMAPVALFGLLHNIVPYLFTKYTARLFQNEAIRTFAYFGIGMLAFPLTYGGFGFWLWHSGGMEIQWTIAYLCLMPPTGFAALRYRRNVLVYRDKILVRTFFWNNAELVGLLRRERQEVIDRFQELEMHYSE